MRVTHTPGPWRVYRDNPANPWLRITAESRDVADVTAIVWNDPKSAGICQANAALMAAAPDLLAAARFAVEFYDKAPRSEYTEPEDITRLRAAIVKAVPNEHL